MALNTCEGFVCSCGGGCRRRRHRRREETSIDSSSQAAAVPSHKHKNKTIFYNDAGTIERYGQKFILIAAYNNQLDVKKLVLEKVPAYSIATSVPWCLDITYKTYYIISPYSDCSFTSLHLPSTCPTSLVILLYWLMSLIEGSFFVNLPSSYQVPTYLGRCIISSIHPSISTQQIYLTYTPPYSERIEKSNNLAFILPRK
ncbi:hypothetical protein EYC80_003777 [Monilinia laxa]|uniref:Uncharacterized protein n=1 Tax=Monilinia laxa TaxID=61186 RepID=A0A5N6KKP2_MONLA|nr:hypothetical protein EYC80_003777 [Monilinia laxa]